MSTIAKIIKNPSDLVRRKNRIIPALRSRIRNFTRPPIRALARKGVTFSKSDAAILQLKDIHKGERCFVIGNGPSLSAADLNLLKGEICFAANKIFLIYSQTDWRPTYYLTEDPLVIRQNSEAIISLQGSTKLLVWNPDVKWPVDGKRTITWDMLLPAKRKYPGFSLDPLSGIYCGHSVCYSAMQFAAYMGIEEINLIGMDFTFSVPNIDKDGYIIGEGEVNHFSKEYRARGEKWMDPKLDQQLEAFTFSRKNLEDRNIMIFNATRGGKLEAFERRDFDNIEF